MLSEQILYSPCITQLSDTVCTVSVMPFSRREVWGMCCAPGGTGGVISSKPVFDYLKNA